MTVRLKLKKLNLQFKKGSRIIDFEENVTFIHGQMSVGKSTVARLIDFCFGGNLVKTVALSQEFVSAELVLDIGIYAVRITRNVDESNILVTWIDEDSNENQVMAPISSGREIWENDIQNFSDLLFYLMGIKPLKVKISKADDASQLVRLSFRDIMWYCYLRQDRLDSDFYKLGTPILQNKSKDVLRFITGQYSEKLFELENVLTTVYREKTEKIGAANQLYIFLKKFGYESEEEIVSELNKSLEHIDRLNEEIKFDREDIPLNTHIVDELKSDLRDSVHNIDEYNKRIYDLEIRIDEQQSLRSELMATKYKMYRTQSAINVLSYVHYDYCPECGKNIIREENNDFCKLCGQENENILVKNIDQEAISGDLENRIMEIEESINMLQNSLSNIKSELLNYINKKHALDDRLGKELVDYDSIFISRIREKERNMAMLEERISNLRRIMEMPLAVKKLEEEAILLGSKEMEIQIEIEKEKENLTLAENNIKRIEEDFLKSLLYVGMPGVSENDRIQINRKTWIPTIYPNSDVSRKWDFYNAGSGGKQTLLNVCYALSIHKIAVENNLLLPDFLIIDSPTKNIDKDINIEIFESLFRYIYELASDVMNTTQFIIIDNELVKPTGYDINFNSILMTNDDPENPPLIPYYKGA